MSWNTISFKMALEITYNDLYVIKEKFGNVYFDETLSEDEKNVALADAFNTIKKWSDFYSRYKDIHDSEIDKLNRDNAILLNDNKQLNKELKEIREKYNTQSSLIGQLQGRLEMMDEVIKAKDNNANMVQVDLVEMIEKLETINSSYESAIKSAIKSAEHKAKMKVFNQRVASGDVKPAKRADVSDEYIIEQFKNGLSAYKIAQSVGMTHQAIVYRIKKLKDAGLIDN